MDCLPDMETFSWWLSHYGSFALFGLLALGIIALPIPEETLMVIAGVLMYNEQLNIPATIIAAFGGSMLGISVSYFLGVTLGSFFLHKYGKWIGLTERRLETVHNWFERLGKWTLVVGYFIPGVRHLTGFAAGSSNLEFRHFALYAYFGAFIWVSTFLSIGYFFGNYWLSALNCVDIHIDEIATIILLSALLAAIFYIFFKVKKAK